MTTAPAATSTVALTGCDSHVHVFDPQRFPYATPRRFTPGVATARQLQAHLDRVGMGRVVLVQPSVYGDRNDCLLDALGRLGRRARGVAVISDRTPQAEIEDLAAAGVIGARLNLAVDHQSDPASAQAQLQALDHRIPADWHIQLHLHLPILASLAPHLAASPRTHVLDHLGLPDLAAGTWDASWQTLLQLLDGGALYVKLSAPYLSSRQAAPYDDLAPFVTSLLARRADRLVWGSNWPHTQGTRRGTNANPLAPEPFRTEDDRLWRNNCRRWAGAGAHALFTANAGHLYRFTEPAITASH